MLRQATGISFLLGAFTATGILMAIMVHEHHSGLAIYLAALSLFHFLEFWLSTKPELEGFLLNHSPEYTLALAAALLEYGLEALLFPTLKTLRYLRWLGVMGVLSGQFIRSWAMVTAGDAFSHVIREVKKPGSRLITDSGPFIWLRHPSYAGFFLWALSLQLVLGNPLMLVVNCWLLLHFFRDRIGYEERLLVQFFGDRYGEYRRRTWSGIPTIK